jgi:lipopolysaccharide biosynthesis glycosyltransferase
MVARSAKGGFFAVILLAVALWASNQRTNQDILRSQYVDSRGREFHVEKARPSEREPGREGEFHVFITSCGDDKVARDAMALIRSVYYTSTSRRRAHVHVTHDGGQAVQTHLVNPIQQLLQFGVLDPQRLRVTHSVTSIQDEHLLDSFKRCSTARLGLAREHLDIDSGIYLDSDMSVNTDLEQLLSVFQDFNDTQWCGCVAEVEEGTGRTDNWYSGKLKDQDWWFRPHGLNAGMMLLNLTRWRATDFTKFSMDFDPATVALDGCCGDQDTINAYFQQHRDQMYVLPCGWNARDDSGCAEYGILHGNKRAFHNGRKRPDRMHFDPLAPWKDPRDLFSGYGKWMGMQQLDFITFSQHQQRQKPVQSPHSRRLYPLVEAANSDEDSSGSSSSRGGFVRNSSSSSSSATSSNDSSDGDSSVNNSDAGAVSSGDSPQRATWEAQRDARRLSYPTRGRVQRDRRESESENSAASESD